MASEMDKAKRWRPRRFSLRTLLIFVLAVACFLGGWMANERRQKEERQAEKERIQRWQKELHHLERIERQSETYNGQ